jgi:hypothetical protein
MDSRLRGNDGGGSEDDGGENGCYWLLLHPTSHIPHPISYILAVPRVILRGLRVLRG